MAFDYPGNFNTSAFPAGRRIAVSRVLGIGILGAFLVIVCTCGLLLWGVHSMRLDPFLISVDKMTGAWEVIGRSVTRTRAVSINETAQQSVVGNFFQNWFSISNIAADNDAVWRQCSAEECSDADTMAYGERYCAISCVAQDKLYNRFIEDVMPIYHLRALAGETWNVMTDTMQITKRGDIWCVQASVWSNISASFDVIAFVRVARAPGKNPLGMGYYVTDFNAYRIK